MEKRAWLSLREFEEIRFEYMEGIAKITINRPRYYNAFTPDTTREISEALVVCREKPEVRVVILTGEGDKAFCSGGDQNVKSFAGYIGKALICYLVIKLGQDLTGTIGCKNQQGDVLVKGFCKRRGEI